MQSSADVSQDLRYVWGVCNDKLEMAVCES
jgi:hypothetical protein